MGSKARYVELPVYVVHIGLLYALLLTSGLVLAWVTIYRHEQNIAELRQMLKTQEDKQQSQAVDIAEPIYTTAGYDKLFQEDENEEIQESDPRVKRDPQKLPKKKKCRLKCVGKRGEKGMRGERGDRGPRGDRGEQGERGLKGNKGDHGERGNDGNMGKTGEKGNKGEPGSPGTKGEPGRSGETLRSVSAHFVGKGDTVPSTPPPGDVYTVKSWKEQHRSGLQYDGNGHLIINVDGVYFVYSQMFYVDRNNTYTGFSVYIDNRQILKAIYSVVDYHKPYHTQFISGIFKINKGQKVWVGTKIKRKYYYNESSAFFGAFMVHP